MKQEIYKKLTAEDTADLLRHLPWQVKQIAQELNVTEQTVYNWRRGDVKVPYPACKILGIL